jgi:SSS family solute:Na+ symporter
MMVQRTLTAKSIGDAKKSYMMMAYVAIWVFTLFFMIGILLNQYYGGREFDNGNTIILEFVAGVGIPGLMGIIAAAVVAASMSSLDSSLNSMATVTTIDFYQKFFNKDSSEEHYLKASRVFTLMWGALIVLPAILFMNSDGSVLEILSKVGSFFVGAKLSAYGLGFYSRHTTEKGLLIGVAAGFICLWYVEVNSDIAWPWYCAIGGAVSVVVGWLASVLLDGFQDDYHPYTVQGQKDVFRSENRPEMIDGWYQMPGKVDRSSYLMLVYFVLTMAALWLFQELI